MTDRRYSIIPARAVTDPRLEGRDLQVLGYLGTFTDKLGWCFVRQGKIAEAIGCGRSTVQRSIARLIEAGWVQTREFNGQRPHACHAYRVVMDLDDPQLEPPEYAVGGDDDDGRCPPVGTSTPEVPEVHHPRAPVPSHGRAPQPSEVPTHTRAHNDQDSGGGSGGGSARAREGRISDDAHRLADELAVIAGHDPAFLPPKWMSVGPAARVQRMLDLGWQPQMMREQANAMMASKRDGPPHSIKYFEGAFARAHAEQSQPSPLPVVASAPSKPERQNARTSQANHDWKRARDDFRSAVGRLGAAIDDSAPAPGGDAGAPALRHVAASGRQ